MTAPMRTASFIAVAAVLALIAWRSPQPDRVTDRAMYETTASQFIIPDCTDLHCFRVLVAWTLGVVPGSSDVKWKSYAVIANATASVAVLALSLAWGLSMRAAAMAAFATAFGFGSLYTLHDPFTSDPLVYALAPIIVLLLLKERVAAAGAIAGVGVLGKEFVAAPLYIFVASSWLAGRRELAMRALVAANAAFMVWLTFQLVMILRFNYGYGDNPSTHLLSGGYLMVWLSKQSARGAASAMINEFGALWLLAPAGLLLAPASLRRFALLSLPVAGLFAYVQQPDRALWNLHFLMTPLAALVLARVQPMLAWSTLGAFAVANLRVGAQLAGIPAARFALAVSMVLAVIALFRAWRAPRSGEFGALAAPAGP
ncbi:MAG: hypothetical protein ABI665_09845 [Vicinamibacterales bacterium]